MTPNGPAIRPAGTIPSIHPDHYREIHGPPPAFPNSLAVGLVPGPIAPSRRPGALVTSPQDLLVTL